MDFSATCLDGMLGGGNNGNGNGNGNGHRLCRSASEMDLEQTSRDQDWRSSSSASIKMARTDSFPTLMRSSSVISDASARMETNNNSSAASDLLESAEAAMLSPYRSCLPFYHHHQQPQQQQQQQQQPGGYQYASNSYKPSGLPLSMGRAETMSSAGMHAILAGTRSPFTQVQWQELEQQALIFKYMVAGVPVPPDLLIPLRRNINIFSSLPVAGSNLRSNLGWSSFHLGFAASNADPEPGRCRRTDGKKWRCSRDAVPDQKYCERHMNRGRHRSRKPVEGQTPHQHHSATAQSSSTSGAANNSSSATSLAAAAARSAVTTTSSTSTTTTIATASSTSSHNSLLRSSISNHQQQQIGTKLSVFPASMSVSGGVASPAASVSPFQIPLNVDRYLNGMKEDIDGPMFESSSHSINGLSMLSSVNNSWGSRNMVPAKTTSNSMMSYGTRTLVDDGGQDFDLLNQNQMSSLLSMTQNQNNASQVLQGFGAGNEEEQQQQQRGIRHNFFDDWPRTSRDRPVPISWTEMERMRSSTSSSATKLSISIPSEFDSPRSPRCEKLMLSPLKLSMSRDADPLGIDPTTQMGLGMGMGMGMGLANQTSEQCRQKQTNWIPITWENPVGGPLAEVLKSTKDCNVKNSALNLMTDGWDCSPRGGDSSRMASPTGVLQKTFGSLSDSSTGSSPRAINVAKAAHDSAGLCENLRTVTFVTGGSAPISTT